jgi:hypothetical protein
MRDLNIKANFRSLKREKLQRVISFGTNWAQDGLKAGAANLKIQREREKKDREFKIKQINKVEDVRAVARETTQKEMIDQIDKFENQFLQNQEKSTDVDDHGDDYMMSSANLQENRSFAQSLAQNNKDGNTKDMSNSLTNMLNNISLVIKNRERELHSEFSRKERDKRRRKMIVDQSKAQKDIEIKRKETLLVDKLIQESRQEEEIRYEMWRNKTCKDIIAENRNLRENQYNEQVQQIAIRETNREEE